ncbi:MAG: hypothetical protein ACPHCM_05845 [Arenicellales bacterium]
MKNLIDFAGWLASTLAAAFALSNLLPSRELGLDPTTLLGVELCLSVAIGSLGYLLMSSRHALAFLQKAVISVGKMAAPDRRRRFFTNKESASPVAGF